jgi:hypothetical protein
LLDKVKADRASEVFVVVLSDSISLAQHHLFPEVSRLDSLFCKLLAWLTLNKALVDLLDLLQYEVFDDTQFNILLARTNLRFNKTENFFH